MLTLMDVDSRLTVDVHNEDVRVVAIGPGESGSVTVDLDQHQVDRLYEALGIRIDAVRKMGWYIGTDPFPSDVV